jgi:hypothetical protein
MDELDKGTEGMEKGAWAGGSVSEPLEMILFLASLSSCSLSLLFAVFLPGARTRFSNHPFLRNDHAAFHRTPPFP